jgi:hypothetical protein
VVAVVTAVDVAGAAVVVVDGVDVVVVDGVDVEGKDHVMRVDFVENSVFLVNEGIGIDFEGT